MALTKAIYNAANESVMLIPRKSPITLSPAPILTINGASLVDTLGRQIDGNADGQPGGNYVAKLSKAGAIVIRSFRSGKIGHPTGHIRKALEKLGLPLRTLRSN